MELNVDHPSDEPSLKKLESLRKSDLIDIATKYKVKIKSGLTKAQLKAVLVQHFVAEGMLSTDSLDIDDESEEVVTSMKKFELKFAHKERKEERDREREREI